MKRYIKPTTTNVNFTPSHFLLYSVQKVNGGDLNIRYGGEGTSMNGGKEARSRELIWGDSDPLGHDLWKE